MDPPEAPVAQECVEGYLFAGRPPKLLLLRRPPARGRIWVPVSGKVDPTDKDLNAALIREVLEETGFSQFLRVFSLEWQVRFDGPEGRPWRLHAYALELPTATPPQLSSEHDGFDWAGFEEARHRLHYADNREALHRLAVRVGPTDPPATVPNV